MMNLSLMDPAFLGGLGGERDPYFANVSLLLHGNGTNGSTSIIDSSPTPKTITVVGNAQISTAQSKFGGGSIRLNGTNNGINDRLQIAAGSAFDFETGDFTVESFFWLDNVTQGAYGCLIEIGNHNSIASAGIGFFLTDATTNVNRLMMFANRSYVGNQNTGYWAGRAMWHWAVYQRKAGVVSSYIDGTEVVYGSGINTSYISAGGVTIGGTINGGPTQDPFFLKCYINELRVTKGIARYSGSTIPVPTGPFPDA